MFTSLDSYNPFIIPKAKQTTKYNYPEIITPAKQMFTEVIKASSKFEFKV
jgi:hypothetical protein